MARTRKYYLKNNYLTLRSKYHEGHYGMRHTALWSCTHIPNIIDLSGKTKKLWSGQALLRRSRRSGSGSRRSGSRRSGRKNQTKTICLPSFEGGDIIILLKYMSKIKDFIQNIRILIKPFRLIDWLVFNANFSSQNHLDKNDINVSLF